jgi:putative Mg2+ transporter-C (MgtC) family protein
MDVFWDELTFGLPERKQFIQVIVRLLASVLIAGLIGYQRESSGKSAGLRTHILVSLGSTVFVLGCIGAGFREDATSRVIQGIVTGIGFIGAGTIIKREAESRIEGLTTSAGLWTTCALGVVVGLGELGIALISGVVAFLVLTALHWFEQRYVEDSTGNDSNPAE